MTSSPQQPTSAASHLFLTASIPDPLFQCTDPLSESARLTSRDIALNETYKWVAIASGSQFAIEAIFLGSTTAGILNGNKERLGEKKRMRRQNLANSNNLSYIKVFRQPRVSLITIYVRIDFLTDTDYQPRTRGYET